MIEKWKNIILWYVKSNFDLKGHHASDWADT